MPAVESVSSETIVCACFRVTESVVVDAITTYSLTSVKEVCRMTNAGAGCTACRLRLRKYLEPGRLPACGGCEGSSACG